MWPFRRRKTEAEKLHEDAVKIAKSAAVLSNAIFEYAVVTGLKAIMITAGARACGGFQAGLFDAHMHYFSIPEEIADEVLPVFVAATRGAKPSDLSVLEACEALATIAAEDLEPAAHEAGWNAADEALTNEQTSRKVHAALALFLNNNFPR